MKTVFSVDQKAKLSNESLMVGVDIAKKTNKGYCRTPDGHEVKPFLRMLLPSCTTLAIRGIFR